MKSAITLVFLLIATYCNSQSEWEIIKLANGNTKGAEIINAIRGEHVFILSDLQKDPLHDEEWRLPGKLHPLVLVGKDRLIDLALDPEIRQTECLNGHCGTRSWCPYTSTWFGCFIVKNEYGELKWKIASWKENEEVKWIDTGLKNCNLIHPAISETGDRLVFASDCSTPNSYDLYICYREKDHWSKALPLEYFNTEDDEVFPSFWGETICFSSNRNDEKSGMDLYYGPINKEESALVFPNPVNSNEDDLNIIFGGDVWAIISSRRKGGEGSEDLYIVRRKADIFANQNARLVLGSVPIRNANISVYDELGVFIGAFKSDEQGKFAIPQLAMGRRYRMEADLGNQKLEEAANIELLNSKDEVVKVISANSKASFWFEMLPYEEWEPLKRLDNPDESVLLSIRINGQVYEEQPGDIGSGEPIILLDDKGNANDLTYTDEKGFFSFEEVLPKATYSFSLNDSSSIKKMQLEGLAPAQVSNSFVSIERLTKDETRTIRLEDGEILEFKAGEPLLVSKIGYEFNKTDPDITGIEQLNKLSQLLKINPHINIEIRSHTDSRGSDDYNLKLSKDRALKASQILIQSGVNANVVEWKGMGESQLLNECNDGSNCDEKDHAINRRTELIIRN